MMATTGESSQRAIVWKSGHTNVCIRSRNPGQRWMFPYDRLFIYRCHSVLAIAVFWVPPVGIPKTLIPGARAVLKCEKRQTGASEFLKSYFI